MAKYDKIGLGYNQSRNADPYITLQLLELLKPSSKGIYLDIGCGTGNYTNALKKHNGHFIGIDPSIEMLNSAKLRNLEVDWKLGTSEETGLKLNSIDGVIAVLTIHHWRDLEKGFAELFRILKPEGSLILFTSTQKQMKAYWLNHYFPKMMLDSIIQMPTLKKIKTALSNSGFELKETKEYFIHAELQDKFLYWGKHKPESYLDEQIRQGISSFSSLANQKEVKRGLTILKEDIASGRINDIMNYYENDLGDYVFIKAIKTTTNKRR